MPEQTKFYEVTVQANAHKDQGKYPYHVVGDWQKKGVQVKRGGKPAKVIISEDQVAGLKADPFVQVTDCKLTDDPSAPVKKAEDAPAETDGKFFGKKKAKE